MKKLIVADIAENRVASEHGSIPSHYTAKRSLLTYQDVLQNSASEEALQLVPSLGGPRPKSFTALGAERLRLRVRVRHGQALSAVARKVQRSAPQTVRADVDHVIASCATVLDQYPYIREHGRYSTAERVPGARWEKSHRWARAAALPRARASLHPEET